MIAVSRKTVARWVLAVAAAGFVATSGRAGAAAKYQDKDCVRCHEQAVSGMASSGGKHRTVGCTTCHEGHPPDVARPYSGCGNCHEPHSADPAGADCSRCHRAHAPSDVRYSVEVPSPACGACHEKPRAELAATKTKHGALSCAICHRGNHRATLACVDCHGRLHPASILARFPECSQCHHTAHDLNHWPDAR